ncbi:MAG: GTP 3',8-cyclase MoaA [Gammaproteobacteria bacterium]
MSSRPGTLTDTLDRPLRDLRISVTDRCNFRCTYCMPRSAFGANHRFLRNDQLLSFYEIERLARVFASCGVRKIRLTGGEPLVRTRLETLVEKLASLPGIEDISLTTNGSLLTRDKAQALKRAGLGRITISLDALDDATFMAINDVDFPVSRVLHAIENAAAAGLSPVKINMVVKRGCNDHSIVPMARFFHGTGHVLRFIEYMDVGNSNGWRHEQVLPAADVAAMISAELPIEPLDANYPGEVARRWRYVDGGGELGIITSITQPFCRSCTRARLSAQGMLYTCLFATRGHDFRSLLREGASDEQIGRRIESIWGRRSDRYSELRTARALPTPKVEMSYIGG